MVALKDAGGFAYEVLSSRRVGAQPNGFTTLRKDSARA